MKKTLSFILALVMMLCMASTAFAADGTTNITFTKKEAALDPFAYTLSVPASLDLENANNYGEGMYMNLEARCTLSNPSLFTYTYNDDESAYDMSYLGEVYIFSLTATCNGLKKGDTTISKSGIDLSFKKQETTRFYCDDDPGYMLPFTAWYCVANDALASMEPGTYTDTITWTVNIDKAS